MHEAAKVKKSGAKDGGSRAGSRKQRAVSTLDSGHIAASIVRARAKSYSSLAVKGSRIEHTNARLHGSPADRSGGPFPRQDFCSTIRFMSQLDCLRGRDREQIRCFVASSAHGTWKREIKRERERERDERRDRSVRTKSPKKLLRLRSSLINDLYAPSFRRLCFFYFFFSSPILFPFLRLLLFPFLYSGNWIVEK